MIDIDGVYYCDECGEPYLLIEGEIDHGRSLGQKNCSVTARLAEMAGIEMFRTSYKLDPKNDLKVIQFFIQRICPEPSRILRCTPAEMEDFQMRKRDNHEKTCRFPSGLRWDRKLRKDVKSISL